MPFPEQGNPYTFSWWHTAGIGLCAALLYVLAITGWRKNAQRKGGYRRLG